LGFSAPGVQLNGDKAHKHNCDCRRSRPRCHSANTGTGCGDAPTAGLDLNRGFVHEECHPELGGWSLQQLHGGVGYPLRRFWSLLESRAMIILRTSQDCGPPGPGGPLTVVTCILFVFRCTGGLMPSPPLSWATRNSGLNATSILNRANLDLG
jgi:hypothetical protein